MAKTVLPKHTYDIEILDPCGLMIEKIEKVNHKTAEKIIKQNHNCWVYDWYLQTHTHYIDGKGLLYKVRSE